MLGWAIVICLLAALAVTSVVAYIGLHSRSHSLAAGTGSSATGPSATDSSASHDAAGTRICGKSILNSPFSYDGPAAAYSSGAAGLPTYGTQRSDFPHDTAGVVLPTGVNNYFSYRLKPNTVYYMLPGTHTGGIQADKNDAFVGGRSGGRFTVLTGNYSSGGQAIDSNPADGDQSGVTIEYLTIEKYKPNANAAAINQEANTGWNILHNTITLNVPGAGVMAGAENTLRDNCLTLNGQYGFQSSDTDGFGSDSLTGGPYDVTVDGNEISYNDTCDFSGLMNNSAMGWRQYQPVPARYRNSKCGRVAGQGDQGGFKLWQSNGVTIADNYIHNNWGPGGWADTNNANTTWTGNTITNNEGSAIIEEISYNFAITNNYIADNGWADGLNNSSFPQAAIYISASGSDTTFGGIPACSEPSCSGQRSYPSRSVISDNRLVDNGGSIFLWQDSNRYCSDGSDVSCTLVGGGRSGPFTVSACRANIRSASVNTTTYVGNRTGSPSEDWWNGCMWETANVRITRNTIDFNPTQIMGCNETAWPDCGAGGIFSEYGSPPNDEPGWVIPTQLTFFQNDTWSGNSYNGPSSFLVWNQGNGDNPIAWANWTGSASNGDKCGSHGGQQSGACTGPFGQDAGSTYDEIPSA